MSMYVCTHATMYACVCVCMYAPMMTEVNWKTMVAPAATPVLALRTPKNVNLALGASA